MLLTRGLVLAVSFLLLKTVVAENGLQVTINDQTQDSEIHRNIGQLLSLNCSVTVPNNSIPVVIKWLKNGVPLTSAITTGEWLVKKISNLTFSDGGYYECEATYQGETRREGVFVNIQGKPLIICCHNKWFTSNPQYINGGNSPVLKCYGTGWPLPVFRWLYNGNEIQAHIGQETGKFKLEPEQHGLRLHLFGLTEQEKGKYTCQAINAHGMDTNVIDVSVFGGTSDDPEIRAVKSHLHARNGQPNVTLMCNGKGVQQLDADTKWFYNGKELKEDNINDTRLVFNTQYYDQNILGITGKVKMQLNIFNVTRSHHGNYTCKLYVQSLSTSVNATISLAVGKSESNQPRSHEPKMLPMTILIPLVVGSVIMVFAIVVVVAVYRNRRKVDHPKIPKGPFTYGAFITYSSQDYAWVQANLLPLLKDNDIEACIHYRNFDIGVLLEQNIVNCVYKSRVVIAVMSKNYMKSKYCRSELDYAIHRSVEEPDSNPLITLKIDKGIKEKQLPLAIRKKTFLDVTSEVEKDNWKHRLLMHVKGKEGDQNRNVLNDEHSINSEMDDENAALNPGQNDRNACIV